MLVQKAVMTQVLEPVERTVQLEDRYALRDGDVFLTGLQAVVRIPVEQHRMDERNGLRTATFISGYPGSPLGTLDLEFVRQKKLLDAHDVTFMPGLNEELAATAVQGSQLAANFGELTHDGVVGAASEARRNSPPAGNPGPLWRPALRSSRA